MNHKHSPLDLMLYLNSLGSFVGLQPSVDKDLVLRELEIFGGNWMPICAGEPGSNRWEIAIHDNGGGIWSPELQRGLKVFGTLGKSHFLKLGRGGFCRYARKNSPLRAESFLVLANLNTNHDGFCFVVDGRQYFLDPGTFFLVNTALAHSLVSFTNSTYFLILNLPFTIANVNSINDLLAQY